MFSISLTRVDCLKMCVHSKQNSGPLVISSFCPTGGHPSPDFADLPHDLPLHSGWRGCVWEVGGQAVGAGARAAGGRGVGQCGVAQCTAKSCNAPRGVCIHSPATYGYLCVVLSASFAKPQVKFIIKSFARRYWSTTYFSFKRLRA